MTMIMIVIIETKNEGWLGAAGITTAVVPQLNLIILFKNNNGEYNINA